MSDTITQEQYKKFHAELYAATYKYRDIEADVKRDRDMLMLATRIDALEKRLSRLECGIKPEFEGTVG